MTLGLFNRVDVSYLNGDQKRILDSFKQLLKTMKFLGFFDDSQKIVGHANGKARSCLDAFGDVMAVKLKHENHDRDLVVMQHKFIIED